MLLQLAEDADMSKAAGGTSAKRQSNDWTRDGWLRACGGFRCTVAIAPSRE
jgi:hypothetical protein